jgi:hypothetical protein
MLNKAMDNFSTFFENRNASADLNIDAQKKMAEFLVNLLVKSEQGDQEAIQMLEMSPDQIQSLVQSQSQQNIQTEAFENLRSKLSGMVGNDRAVARFNMMLSSLNKKLWELENDLKNANVQNTREYTTMLRELQRVDPNIKPEGGFFQKKAYGVGRTVGKVGAFAARAGTIAAAAASLGSLGLPSYAIGGIIGGGVSALKNLKNKNLNKKQKLKKVLVSAGLGAVLGFAFSKLRAMTDGVDFSSSPDADTASTTPDADASSTTPDGSYDVGDTLMGGKVEVLYNGDDGVVVSSKQKILTSLGDSKGMIEAQKMARMRGTAALAEILGTDTLQGVNAEYVDGGDGYVYAKVSIATDGTIDPSFETTQQDFNEPVTDNNVGTGETPDLERLQNMPRIPNETFSYTDNAKGYLLSNNPKGISIAVDTNIVDTDSAFKDENTALKYFSKLTGLSVDEVANQMQEIGTDTNRGRGALNFGKTSYYYFPKR